jgi:O-antigen ligase/polysaccharide polymerase Wzy-like membrane protein
VRLSASLVAGTVGLATIGLLFLAPSPALAFLPMVATAVAFAIWRAPIRYSVFGLLFATLTVDIPADIPAAGYWKSPLYPIGSFLFENLHVPGAHVSPVELLIVLMMSMIVVRMVTGSSGEGEIRFTGVNVLDYALLGMLATIAALEVWGVARGGDFRQSLWQMRELLWLPVVAALFAHSIRERSDLVTLARVIIVAACIKVAIGLYFLLAVARPAGIDPPHVTSHHDSVLFVTAIAIVVTAWAHRPTLARFVAGSTIVSWIFVGLLINNRRIAFVSLFGSLFVLFFLLRGPLKRTLTRLGLILAPVFVLYLAVGGNRTSGVFKPAAKIMSVITQKDNSSSMRGIEDYNLVATLKGHAVFGTGWGHEYNEVTKAIDISTSFEQYRYIAHNSVLWLIAIGGYAGFTLMWLPFVVSIFLATRSYRFARTVNERSAAAVALAVILSFLIQAWGDMGMQGWSVSFLVAAAIATTGKLAFATGAWPQRARLVARSPNLRKAA